LERGSSLADARITALRDGLRDAERAGTATRGDVLRRLADQVESEAGGSGDAEKMRTLAATLEALAAG
jgi:hypothetical protein